MTENTNTNGVFVVENTEEAMEKMTIKELKIKAKEGGLTGYSSLKKAELIELIKAEVPAIETQTEVEEATMEQKLVEEAVVVEENITLNKEEATMEQKPVNIINTKVSKALGMNKEEMEFIAGMAEKFNSERKEAFRSFFKERTEELFDAKLQQRDFYEHSVLVDVEGIVVRPDFDVEPFNIKITKEKFKIDSSTPYYALVVQGVVKAVMIDCLKEDIDACYKFLAQYAYYGVPTMKDGRFTFPAKAPKNFVFMKIKRDQPLGILGNLETLNSIFGESVFKYDNPMKAVDALFMTPSDFILKASNRPSIKFLVTESLSYMNGNVAICDGTIFMWARYAYKTASELRDEKLGGEVNKLTGIHGSFQVRTDNEYDRKLPAIKGKGYNDFAFCKQMWDKYGAKYGVDINSVDGMITMDALKTHKDDFNPGDVIEVRADAIRIVKTKMGKWRSSFGRQALRVDHELEAKKREKYGADANAALYRKALERDYEAFMKVQIGYDFDHDDSQGFLLRYLMPARDGRIPMYETNYKRMLAVLDSFFVKEVIRYNVFDDALYAQDNPFLDVLSYEFNKKFGKVCWFGTIPKGKKWAKTMDKYISTFRHPVVTKENAQGIIIIGHNNSKNTIEVPSLLLGIMFGDSDGDYLGIMVDDELQHPMRTRMLKKTKADKVLAKDEDGFLELCKDVVGKICKSNANIGIADNALTQYLVSDMYKKGPDYNFNDEADLRTTLGAAIEGAISSMKHLVSTKGETTDDPRKWLEHMTNVKLGKVKDAHPAFHKASKNAGVPNGKEGTWFVSQKRISIDFEPSPKDPFYKTFKEINGLKTEIRHDDSFWMEQVCTGIWYMSLGYEWNWEKMKSYTSRVGYIKELSKATDKATVMNGRIPSEWNKFVIEKIGKMYIDSCMTDIDVARSQRKDEVRRKAFMDLARYYNNRSVSEYIVGKAFGFKKSVADIEYDIALKISTGGDIYEYLATNFPEYQPVLIDVPELVMDWDFGKDTVYVYPYVLKGTDDVARQYVKIFFMNTDKTKFTSGEAIMFQRALMVYVGKETFGYSNKGTGKPGSPFWHFDKVNCIVWMFKFAIKLLGFDDKWILIEEEFLKKEEDKYSALLKKYGHMADRVLKSEHTVEHVGE